jgi:phosphatidylinositol alpha-mannosyltransferase
MHNKLKIGFLLDDGLDSSDGVQQYVLTLGEWFSSNGHEVHYLVGQTIRKDINNLHSLAKNIKVSFNQNKLTVPLPADSKKIKKVLKDLDLDILHVQMPYSPLFASKVINIVDPKVKVIGTFHIVPAGKIEKLASKLLSYTVKKSLKRFDNIISVSTAAQKFAIEVFNIDSVVIPNVVSVHKFISKPIYNEFKHVVFLGRLVERKGCKYLLEALVELNKRDLRFNYTVTIAGKGAQMDKLKEYAKNNHLQNVQFIGYVSEEDKPKLLASADIAVFPSTGGESFGIVLIEAMAAGSRVILGGNNIGYKTVLGEYPKLLINPFDKVSFADNLELFLTNNNEIKRAFEWSQSQISKYDVNNVAKKILAIYKG